MFGVMETSYTQNNSLCPVIKCVIPLYFYSETLMVSAPP